MKFQSKLAVVVGAVVSLPVLGVMASGARDVPVWLSAGQNLHNTRNQAAEVAIGPGNAGQLAVKWVFNTGGDVSATPAVDDRFVYVPDSAGNLFKIDKETGAKSGRTRSWTTRASSGTWSGPRR